MRSEFANAILKFAEKYPEIVFITGDLGFMALEKVRDKLGDHFINAGVAEQNMVSIAAAIAREGMKPWVYSIAPFIVLRPFEQIRNDVCLHNLPVKLVGNGGGYGYGIMGSTHHVLEDIGLMRILPNMRVYVPFVSSDVEQAISLMLEDPNPNYLRLNIGARISQKVSPFNQWRKLNTGEKAVVIGTGPVLENILNLEKTILDDLDVWVVSLFPLTSIPEELFGNISKIRRVIIIEEHYAQCGLNESIAALLLGKLSTYIHFYSLSAEGYPSGRYGNQQWHLIENNLAGDNLKNKIMEFLS